MLRKFFDYQHMLIENSKFKQIKPLVSALDAFCYEPAINTKKSPHIRDAVDLKRWMFIVILGLIPCIMMAIWNTGLQKMVYGSGNSQFMNEYLMASETLQGYFAFAFKDRHYVMILKEGLLAFIPVMLISYVVGGLWEALFAVIRGHEIAEGFLVTGMLYPLILPPTIPYWMVAVGVSAGVVIGKELFGGTGMNILNPALTCRAFLFFTFPGKMTGDVWVGTNPTQIVNSLTAMNSHTELSAIDGYSQATVLQGLNGAIPDIKRIHVDAIATNSLGNKVSTIQVIEKHFDKWNAANEQQATLGDLSLDQMQQFVTSDTDQGGLGLASSNFEAAYKFAATDYGLDKFTDGNLLLGNRLGSMGETSIVACLIGAAVLLYFGVASWRIMIAMALGAFLTAFLFEFFSKNFGVDGGAWNPAKYSMSAYRHLIMGGFAFALVFMATDPVSAPAMKLSKWIYGAAIGAITILIRLINPAYPEGVMLAILFANVFAPLIDFYVVRNYRRVPRVANT